MEYDLHSLHFNSHSKASTFVQFYIVFLFYFCFVIYAIKVLFCSHQNIFKLNISKENLNQIKNFEKKIIKFLSKKYIFEFFFCFMKSNILHYKRNWECEVWV